jgi:subtilisin family serine protease
MAKLSCDPYGREEGTGADPQYSGRTLVLMRSPAAEAAFRDFAAITSRMILAVDGGVDVDSLPYYPRFGIGVLPYSVNELSELTDSHGVLKLERARILEQIRPAASYQMRVLKEAARLGVMPIGDPLYDMGVKANHDGANVRLAILDGGLDLDHRDFVNRPFSAASFAPDESVAERIASSGHSTHCTGLAAGPLVPAHAERRYGVAGNAYLLVGKVKRTGGPIDDGDLVKALNWAFSENADVVVVPLGASARANVETSSLIETTARNGLLNGHLVVAAAGDASSATTVQPVFHPANCRSIMAVGALDDLASRPSFRAAR